MKRQSHNTCHDIYHSIRNHAVRLSIVPLLSGVLLSCGALPAKDEPSEALPEQGRELVKGDDIAASRVDEGLIFNLLAGEFAGVRGQMKDSIEYYAKAAEISQDPDVISRAAYIALYAGNNEQAIELTDRWLLVQPDGADKTDKTVERIRALAYLRLQKLLPSVELIEKNIFYNGRIQPRSMASLTHILSKEATPQFALQIIKLLDKRHPNEPGLMLLMAKFEASQGRFDEALLHVNELIELDRNLTDAYLIKAQIFAASGQQQKAVESIAAAIEGKPEDTHLRLQYARMLVQMKSFKKATEQFIILRKEMPNDENVLLSLGLLSIETARYHQGKEYLQELLDKGYNNQQAHYYLGRIQQSQGEDMAAIANYERIEGGEYLLDARIRSAGLIANSGKTQEALDRLESLSHKDHSEPDQVKLELAKGQVLNTARRSDEAYKLYNNALRRSPENTDLLYARALTAEKLDLLDVTESDLKMVITHEPENASALNALGYTLADRTERLAEAREYILKAARLLPDDPAILDSLGWVYYRLGQYEDAIKWLSKAFQVLEDAEIAAHLGEVLWMDGQMDKARNIWKKAEKLEGNKTVLHDTMRRLKNRQSIK